MTKDSIYNIPFECIKEYKEASCLQDNRPEEPRKVVSKDKIGISKIVEEGMWLPSLGWDPNNRLQGPLEGEKKLQQWEIHRHDECALDFFCWAKKIFNNILWFKKDIYIE